MVTMRMKMLFFDSAAVIRAVDRAKRQSMQHAGGWIRKTARRSIKKNKTVSKPGQPPHSHAGQLRGLIFYAYDPGSESVVIGPLRFRRGEAPKLLEFGGKVSRKDRRSGRRRRRRPQAADQPRVACEHSVSESTEETEETEIDLLRLLRCRLFNSVKISVPTCLR